MIKSWLAHPLTRGLHLDDPRTTELRRQVISQNSFLVSIYRDWYQQISDLLPNIDGCVLELGSGGGFMEEYIPDLITSEILPITGTQITLDGQTLPFANQSLRAIVMTNVLHHIPDNRKFFSEAIRCIRSGGCIVMVEPWNTIWSRLIYNLLHHEPFEPNTDDWVLEPTGPLSAANDALPWIILGRDKEIFLREFPEWSIEAVQLIMPFLYLVSGGVSLRQLMPRWSYRIWKGLETALAPFRTVFSMFALIHLVKK
jgi:SAM-dependent methyltransferase